MEVFGFHKINKDNEDNEDNENNEENINKDEYLTNYYQLQNGLNILSWFPVTGTITSLIRSISVIILKLKDKDKKNKLLRKDFYTVSILRSIIEFFQRS